MKRLVVGGAILTLLMLGLSQASGGWGGCGPGVTYQYVTEYRDVQRTVCETVPVTTTVEVEQVVCTPVTSKQERTETYYEQVPKNVERTVMVCEMVPRN